MAYWFYYQLRNCTICSCGLCILYDFWYIMCSKYMHTREQYVMLVCYIYNCYTNGSVLGQYLHLHVCTVYVGLRCVHSIALYKQTDKTKLHWSSFVLELGTFQIHTIRVVSFNVLFVHTLLNFVYMLCFCFHRCVCFAILQVPWTYVFLQSCCGFECSFLDYTLLKPSSTFQ